MCSRTITDTPLVLHPIQPILSYGFGIKKETTSGTITTTFFSDTLNNDAVDTFDTNHKVVHHRYTSRTVRGGRRNRYDVHTISSGSTPWTRFVYFGNGRSVYRLKAIQKSQDVMRRRTSYQNYVILRSTGLSLERVRIKSSFKRSSLDTFISSQKLSHTSIHSNPIFEDSISSLFDTHKLFSKSRGSRNRLLQIRSLYKHLHCFSDDSFSFYKM